MKIYVGNLSERERFEHDLARDPGALGVYSDFECEDCEDEGCVHCDPEHDDPTLWCNGCGARAQDDCDCGPIASND